MSKARGKSRKANRRKRGRPMLPAVLALVAGLLLIGSALALALNRQAPPAAGGLPDSHDEEGIPYPEVPRVSLAEARAKFEGQAAIFLDVRAQSEYERAHIPGAVSLPLADLETGYQDLQRDAEIITYCT